MVINLSYGEKIHKERQEGFKQKVEPRLNTLSELGNCISNLVMDNIELLDKGEELLARCYAIAGLNKPAWLDLRYEGGKRLAQYC